MSAFFEIIIGGLKQFSADIIAVFLFAFCMWKFPKLRSFLNRYGKNPAEKEEVLKKLEDIQNQLNEVQRQHSTQKVQQQKELREQLHEVQKELKQKDQEQEAINSDIGYFTFLAIVLPWFIWSLLADIGGFILIVVLVIFQIALQFVLIGDNFKQRHPKLFAFIAVFCLGLIFRAGVWCIFNLNEIYHLFF